MPGATRSLPTVSFAEVFHVGTLDAADKGAAHESLEGDGLSFSLHPKDWRHIARLGGAPTWKLTKPGNTFVDFWQLEDRQLDAAYTWACDAGLATRCVLWSVTVTDDDGPSWSLYATEAEAAGEHTFNVENGLDSVLAAVDGLAATEALRARMRHSCPPGIVEDFAVLAYAVDVAGADGVWWDDNYDPAALSCPRGVIAPQHVASFDVRRID